MMGRLWASRKFLGRFGRFRVTWRVDFMRTVTAFQKIPYRPRVGGSSSLQQYFSLLTAPMSIGVCPYVVFKHTLVFLVFCVYNRHIATRNRQHDIQRIFRCAWFCRLHCLAFCVILYFCDEAMNDNEFYFTVIAIKLCVVALVVICYNILSL